ncbi:hypothetical protein M5362_03435 [Streptomyces sp. Je 1-79]|uniref:hypothetical protein n=1 Tax=Streptomyces sp. Je 1-79 TaxID=2943847 RepID=UPI0021A8A5BB|nr:hypothetical protein [Streptomyces sp. Je 1-79]MCT4352183.1 hypothetical protein [Streptomyces sp. Je 1-79]
MTGIQALATAPTALLDLDPYRFPPVFIDDRYEETSTARGSAGFGDCPLPAPEPSSRLSIRLEPADRRRLELHAALTTAGIAPLPGDLDAIEALCTLDDTTHSTLRRWLNRFGTP